MSAPTECGVCDSEIRGGLPRQERELARNDREFGFAMTGKSALHHRTTERYRAAQGKNDYTNLPHDLAARPAGKFQFICLLREAGSLKYGMYCQNSRTSMLSLGSLLMCMRRQTMEAISRKPRIISDLCPVRSMQTSVSR